MSHVEDAAVEQPAPRRLSRRRVAVAAVAIAAIAGAVIVLSNPLPAEQGPRPRLPEKIAMVRGVVPNPPGEESGVLPGRAGTNFEWIHPNGRTQRLSDLRGKVVVLNWWATWCLPCVEEMPTLDRVAATEPEITFLEVDLYEYEDVVEAFFAKHGLRHLVPVIDFNGVVARRYGLAGIPQTYFLDARGIVRHVEIGGPMDEETIRDGIALARGR